VGGSVLAMNAILMALLFLAAARVERAMKEPAT
jgi:hypothetical protein